MNPEVRSLSFVTSTSSSSDDVDEGANLNNGTVIDEG